MAADCLMRYPNHNLPFKIYADASDYQMGACIMQQGVQWHTGRESYVMPKLYYYGKELLLIVCVLEGYKTMLFGAHIDIYIYTDHRNLTLDNLNSQRIDPFS